ncbi:hypothetical protein AAL_00556 [Moelleriella libera RCEF 2490]|uniref:F-box domain-containing protein n=1 Tax=Moelleriella libera RCEF 2490 TaxID=1081109 RepID=A0A166UY46_9HYPO|nr:hypothetical protein AAL_00556 [Moelleriella libera RCEF 2490]
MLFLDLPIEIRLHIYSDLLVQDDAVEFGADLGPRDPRLMRYRVDNRSLCPAVLRVNKLVNSEATPILYSANRFRFPDAYTSFGDSLVPYIVPFLQQVGRNASLLQHICIKFPAFCYQSWEKPVLRKELIHVFQGIRDACLGLKTIEISSKPAAEDSPSLEDVDLVAEMLRVLDDDGGFRLMPSLESILIMRGEYVIDGEVLALRESLMQRMPSPKWSIELIEIPPRRWISADDRVAFDNCEDCYAYDEELSRLEWEREERREQEQWEEELRNRRNDPFWKNDSDYD